jgi:DNA topoisomerase-1
MPSTVNSRSSPDTGTSQVTTNNGRVNGDAEDYSMSDDDDKPLVRINVSNVFTYLIPIAFQLSSELRTPNARTQKRKKPIYAESSSDDDTPLASSSPAKPAKPSSSVKQENTQVVNGNGKIKHDLASDDDSGSDNDYKTKNKKQATRPRKSKAPPKKRLKKETNGDSTHTEDKLDGASKPSVAKRKRAPKVESDAENSSSEDDKPLTKKTNKKAKEEPAVSEPSQGKKKVKKEETNGSPKKGRAKKKEEEEEEEVYKWWEAENPEGDGTVKWQTLEHNGVIFPPPYEPLPSDVKMKYNGIFGLVHLHKKVTSHFSLKVNLSISRLLLKKWPGSMLRCWRLLTLRMLSSTRTSLRTGRKFLSRIHPFVADFWILCLYLTNLS